MGIWRAITFPFRMMGKAADFGGHNPLTSELQDWLIPHHEFMFPIPRGMSPQGVTSYLEKLGVRVWGKMLMGDDVMAFSVYQGHALRAWQILERAGIQTGEDAQSIQRRGIHGAIMGAIWSLFGLHRLMGVRRGGRDKGKGKRRLPFVLAGGHGPFRLVRWAGRAIGL